VSDIFISYASEDRETAKQLAEVLGASGWSVWWDRSIPAGKNFDDMIEEAIEQSKCMIVLWSNASISSRWVKTEAAEGEERNMLIPVLIENVKIPLAFRRLQAADLIGWDGEAAAAQITKLVADAAIILGPPPAQATTPDSEQVEAAA
jgi:hypothetical protein